MSHNTQEMSEIRVSSKIDQTAQDYRDILLISAYDALRISFIIQFHIRESIKGFIRDAC